MPDQSSSARAIIGIGGKQYLVNEGDRILVDRLASEPGSEITLERVLMVTTDDGIKTGSDAAAAPVSARVIGHEKGPRVVAFRYKSKKHVRVRHGSRAALTAIEITGIGGAAGERAKKPTRAVRAKAEDAAATEAEAAGDVKEKAATPARKRTARRREEPASEETTDGA